MSKRIPQAQTAMLTMPDAVDLIRFEKNLLQIGFFGSHEKRDKLARNSRRIEQWVNRDGKKIKVSAEFRSSDTLGLPSSADRDKFMAFMKLAMEQKVRNGVITNPVTFSGYSLLAVLDFCDSGENYEALNNWGMRMADTTITSEQVIYSSARKKYMNKTVHVFRSFTRVGSSDLDGSNRAERFEVELEDWLLENLNDSFVVPEDFNMYRKLARPTAKGIFVYLYLWFYASQGKPVEKDYNELCSLLNIRSYEHASKIKETIGLALADLVNIGYLKTWDVKPMTTKNGFKLVLTPGRAIKEILELTQRKQLAFAAGQIEVPLPPLRQEARDAMLAMGVSELKATELARKYEPAGLLDRVDYVTFQLESDSRGNIKNPAGYFISFIESEQKIPNTFQTRRQRQAAEKTRRAAEAARATENERALEAMQLQEEYQNWSLSQADDFIARELTGQRLDKKLKEISSRLRKDATTSKQFDRMMPDARRDVLMRHLQREVLSELTLPTLHEWKVANPQAGLF